MDGDAASHPGEARLFGIVGPPCPALKKYREAGQIGGEIEAWLAEAEASAGETDAGLRRLDETVAHLTEDRQFESASLQSDPVFPQIGPNNRIPAIVDLKSSLPRLAQF
jgi:hypothetical protein